MTRAETLDAIARAVSSDAEYPAIVQCADAAREAGFDELVADPLVEAAYNELDPDDQSEFKDVAAALRKLRVRARTCLWQTARRQAKRITKMKGDRKGKGVGKGSEDVVPPGVGKGSGKHADVPPPPEVPAAVVMADPLQPPPDRGGTRAHAGPAGGHQGSLGDPLTWVDVRCDACGQAAVGQYKYAPELLTRKATWYMRVKTADGEWPLQGYFFRARRTTIVGADNTFALRWIGQHKRCLCG